MTKLPALLAASAVGLAACALDPYEQPPQYQEPARTTTTEPPAPAPSASATVPGTLAYRPGFGTVESVTLVRTGPVAPSASAGGSTVTPLDRAAYQLGVRMEDGTVQSVVQDNRAFMVGDRVQLTSDGRIVRL